MSAQELPTLITFPLSHYCEKARWALQRYGVKFTEQGFAPGFHRSALKAAGGKGSVPLLRLPGGACVDESTPILHWVDERAREAGGQAPPLFPADTAARAQVEGLVADFDKTLGPMVRVWVYSHLLYTPGITAAFVAPPVPRSQAAFLNWGGIHLLRFFIRKGLKITPENGEKALGKIRASFDRAAALLQDGRPFLAGDHFSAADLTFAALAAPALGQPYGSAPGLSDESPPAYREVVEELRAHPASRHAMRMWQELRGEVCAAGGKGRL